MRKQNIRASGRQRSDLRRRRRGFDDWPPWLEKALIHEPVRLLSDFGREIMTTVRMLETQILRLTVKPIDLCRCSHDFINAPPLEIGIVERSINKYRPRGERGNEFVKIEWNLAKPTLKLEKFRHIAIAGPAFDIAVHVVEVRIEAAARDDYFDALVEDGGINGVMSAEGMTQRTEPAPLDERKSFQQIEAADIVRNRFHRSALVTKTFQVRL